MYRKFIFSLIGLSCTFYLISCVMNASVLAQKTKSVTEGNSSRVTGVFPRSQVILVTASGRHRFTVEVAVTDAQRRLGLMNRQHLAPDTGMLFDFGSPRLVAMWMKNTLIPLDMIFIAADGRIVRVATGTKPYSLEPISSGSEVKAVLEVNGGVARHLGIKPGDWIEHGIFTKTK